MPKAAGCVSAGCVSAGSAAIRTGAAKEFENKTGEEDLRDIDKVNSSGVYICKSVVNDLRHVNYICKSE